MTPPSALPLTNLRVMDDLATRGPRFAATATDALVEAMVRAGEPGRRHLVIAFTKYVGQGEAIVSPAALVPIARRTEAVLYLGTLPDRAPYPPDFFRFAGEAAAATGGQLLLGTAPQPTGDIYDSYQFDSLKPDLGGGTIVPYSDMVKAFAQVIYDFRRSYLLSYTPEGVSREGWHDITVKVAQPASGQYTVRARKGYPGERPCRLSWEAAPVCCIHATPYSYFLSGRRRPRARRLSPPGCSVRHRSRALFRAVVAEHRPVPRRPRVGRHRRDRTAGRLLHGTAARRRVEDDRRRHDVVSDLRRREGSVVGRRDRGRAVGSQRHLRRHGRPDHRRRHQRGQRRLQVDRRRQDLEAPGARRHQADSRRSSSIRRIRTSCCSPRRATSTRSRDMRGVYPQHRRRTELGSRRSTSTARPARRRSRGRSIIRA